MFNAISMKEYLRDQKGYTREEATKACRNQEPNLVSDFNTYLEEEMMKYEALKENEEDVEII